MICLVDDAHRGHRHLLSRGLRRLNLESSGSHAKLLGQAGRLTVMAGVADESHLKTGIIETKISTLVCSHWEGRVFLGHSVVGSVEKQTSSASSKITLTLRGAEILYLPPEARLITNLLSRFRVIVVLLLAGFHHLFLDGLLQHISLLFLGNPLLGSLRWSIFIFITGIAVVFIIIVDNLVVGLLGESLLFDLALLVLEQEGTVELLKILSRSVVSLAEDFRLLKKLYLW